MCDWVEIMQEISEAKMLFHHWHGLSCPLLRCCRESRMKRDLVVLSPTLLPAVVKFQRILVRAQGPLLSFSVLAGILFRKGSFINHTLQRAEGSTKSYQSDCQQRDLVNW